VDVAVADLPEGSDPGDLARSDPDALRAAVTGARPFLQFRLERVLAAGDLATAEGRARTAESALAVVGEHPSDLVRDQYVMQVADRCRLDVAQLRDRLRHGVKTPSERPVEVRHDIPLPRPELEALRLAVQEPEEMVPLLDELLFVDDRCVVALRALTEAQGDVRGALDRADPAAADVLQRVAVQETDAEVGDVVARLATEAARRTLVELEQDARASEAPLEFAPAVAWLKLLLEHLRDPRQARESTAQLVSWLRERAQEPR
jgi:DNA primase